MAKERRMASLPLRLAVALVGSVLGCLPATGAESVPPGGTLTLEACHRMAVAQSKELGESRLEMDMAGQDRKIARANWFPKIGLTGAYAYNNRDMSLIGEEQSERLRNAGTLVTDKAWDALMQHVSTSLGEAILQSLRDNVLPDIATPINAIGQEIDDALHPDTHHLLLGAVTVQQPLFVGGKILYSNQMAALAEELAQAKYDTRHADLLLEVDQAYWQIVSISAKKELAESYADLLHHMSEDVQVAISAGVSTEADALQVKVKASEADMLLAKATNGLVLSKMLLCKRIGLPLESAITLADEHLASIPTPEPTAEKQMEDIYRDRPELRSLLLATRIFDKKAKVVRADMLPTVALLGAFTVTNPNTFNGFQNTWQGGNLSVGALVQIPLFHGGEALSKYRKARMEANLYRVRLENARQLVELQVTRQRKIVDESARKLAMAESNMQVAEENLRAATLGFEAGIVPTNTVLGAHTAWLSAHSECIDAGIELQMASVELKKAEGTYTSESVE